MRIDVDLDGFRLDWLELYVLPAVAEGNRNALLKHSVECRGITGKVLRVFERLFEGAVSKHSAETARVLADHFIGAIEQLDPILYGGVIIESGIRGVEQPHKRNGRFVRKIQLDPTRLAVRKKAVGRGDIKWPVMFSPNSGVLPMPYPPSGDVFSSLSV